MILKNFFVHTILEPIPAVGYGISLEFYGSFGPPSSYQPQEREKPKAPMQEDEDGVLAALAVPADPNAEQPEPEWTAVKTLFNWLGYRDICFFIHTCISQYTFCMTYICTYIYIYIRYVFAY